MIRKNMLEIGQPILQGTLDFNLSLPKFQSFKKKKKKEHHCLQKYCEISTQEIECLYKAHLKLTILCIEESLNNYQ